MPARCWRTRIAAGRNEWIGQLLGPDQVEPMQPGGELDLRDLLGVAAQMPGEPAGQDGDSISMTAPRRIAKVHRTGQPQQGIDHGLVCIRDDRRSRAPRRGRGIRDRRLVRTLQFGAGRSLELVAKVAHLARHVHRAHDPVAAGLLAVIQRDVRSGD
jgi:hypothetical protein